VVQQEPSPAFIVAAERIRHHEEAALGLPRLMIEMTGLQGRCGEAVPRGTIARGVHQEPVFLHQASG
jgi:hypothetical protein